MAEDGERAVIMEPNNIAIPRRHVFESFSVKGTHPATSIAYTAAPTPTKVRTLIKLTLIKMVLNKSLSSGRYNSAVQ
jgi:hypothetical protein